MQNNFIASLSVFFLAMVPLVGQDSSLPDLSKKKLTITLLPWLRQMLSQSLRNRSLSIFLPTCLNDTRDGTT